MPTFLRFLGGAGVVLSLLTAVTVWYVAYRVDHAVASIRSRVRRPRTEGPQPPQ